MTPTGEINLKPDGFIEVDHLVICRVVRDKRGLVLQFYDRNDRRSRDRGSNLVDVIFADLVEKLGRV